MADNKLWQEIRAIEEKDLPYAKATDKLYELFANKLVDIKQMVVDLRNEAHINCLEEQKQAFNTVINILEKNIKKNNNDVLTYPEDKGYSSMKLEIPVTKLYQLTEDVACQFAVWCNLAGYHVSSFDQTMLNTIFTRFIETEYC